MHKKTRANPQKAANSEKLTVKNINVFLYKNFLRC